MATKKTNPETITLSCGYEYHYNPATFDDYELLEDLAEMESGNRAVLPRVVDKVFGADKKTLFDSLRDDTGKVPTTKVIMALGELFSSLKNSQAKN
ncbi:MAG: hypothetical protein IJ206_13095 [Oscillospiraceae bacterium]|nr:hypothetical protein [Oscillospiraceae bacterium]